MEDGRLVGVHLVDEGVEEAERLARLAHRELAEQAEEGAHERRGHGGAAHRLHRARDLDKEVVTDGGDVGEAATGAVEHGSVRQCASGVVGREVLGHCVSLPRGLVGVPAEAAAGREAGALVGDGLLGAVLRALEGGALADGWRVRQVGDVHELGGADGGDPRAAGGEVRLQLRLAAVRAQGVGAAVGARVAGRDQHGNTAQGDLLELGVDNVDVALRVHAESRAFVRADAPNNGDDAVLSS